MPPPRRPRWKRWLILCAGWGFVLLGIAGIFLPVLQGLLFLGVGLYLLSRESARAQRVLDWLDRRFPQFHAVRGKAARRAVRILARFNNWRQR